MFDPSSLLLAACANCTQAAPSISDLPATPCDSIQIPILSAQSNLSASACVSHPETDQIALMSSPDQTSDLSPAFTPAQDFAAARRLSRIDRLHQALKTATCSNDWNTAIDATSQLIGSYGLTDASREEFIQFRYRLQNWNAEDATVAVADCGDRWAAEADALAANQQIATNNAVAFTTTRLAQASRSNIEQHHQALKVAACLNDWDTAIDAASQLIGTYGLTDASRQEFIQFRYRLQNWSAEDATLTVADCDRVIAAAEVAPVAEPSLPNRSLNWSRAIENLGIQ